MKKKLPYLLAALILFFLLLYWQLSRNIAFIPSWNRGLFIATIIICSGLFVAFLRAVYRSYPTPVKPVQWVYMFLLGILVGGLGFFGIAFASLDNKTTGIFRHFDRAYHFEGVSFYIYETHLMGTSAAIRYSRPGEIVSHPIDEAFYWNVPDSIKIEKAGEGYWISTAKKKILFKINKE